MQFNQEIGSSYQVIDRDRNYDEFAKAFEICFKKRHVADLDTESDNFTKNCYMLLVVERGSEIIPLYAGQSNYIMTERGVTFNNLSLK